MTYLCLGYYDPEKFGALPAGDVDNLVRECHAHDAALRESGHLVIQASLRPPESATILRPRSGTVSVTDGPFAETKEQVGAFFIIEARDLSEAIRVASKHPAANLGEHVGWGIEVRAIDAFERL